MTCTQTSSLGAEGSIIVSIVGVLCVAFAFKFWMLLGGTFTLH